MSKLTSLSLLLSDLTDQKQDIMIKRDHNELIKNQRFEVESKRCKEKRVFMHDEKNLRT